MANQPERDLTRKDLEDWSLGSAGPSRCGGGVMVVVGFGGGGWVLHCWGKREREC